MLGHFLLVSVNPYSNFGCVLDSEFVSVWYGLHSLQSPGDPGCVVLGLDLP